MLSSIERSSPVRKIEVVVKVSDEVVSRLLAFISEVTETEMPKSFRALPLMGGESPIDSVALVEICVRFEDYASEIGFEFDWTSETAMSRSKSIFKTVGTLVDEFLSQMNAKDG